MNNSSRIRLVFIVLGTTLMLSPLAPFGYGLCPPSTPYRYTHLLVSITRRQVPGSFLNTTYRGVGLMVMPRFGTAISETFVWRKELEKRTFVLMTRIAKLDQGGIHQEPNHRRSGLGLVLITSRLGP